MSNWRKEDLPQSFVSPFGTTEVDLKLACMHWTNVEGDLTGVVIGLHGVAEHAGRYEEFGNILNQRGFLLSMYDHRGHGKSEGSRAWADNIEYFVDDAIMFADAVKKCVNDDVPVFLFGHSMGGMLALLTSVKMGGDAFRGVVLSSPAVQKGPEVGAVTIFAAKALNFFASKLVILALDPTVISTLEEEQQRYLNDPLNISTGTTAGMGAALLAGLDLVAERVPTGFTAPFIVIHGDADTLVSPEGTHWLVEEAPSTDKTKVMLKGSRHESFNDINKAEAFESIIRWIEARK